MIHDSGHHAFMWMLGVLLLLVLVLGVIALFKYITKE